MLADAKSTKTQDEAKTFIDRVASLLASVVLLISVLGSLCAPILVWIIASGLYEEPLTFTTASQLTRIMFPVHFLCQWVPLVHRLNTWKDLRFRRLGFQFFESGFDLRYFVFSAAYGKADLCLGNRRRGRRLSAAGCSNPCVVEERVAAEARSSAYCS